MIDNIEKIVEQDIQKILSRTARRKIKFGGETNMVEKVTFTDVIKKALTESGTGGVLVPEEHATYIYQLLQEASVLRKAGATVINMKSNILTIPRMITGATAYWVDEATPITESTQSFDTLTLIAKKLAALTVISTELIEDSDPSVERIVMDNLARVLAIEMDKEMLIGDGTHLTGIVNTAGVNAIDKTGTALTFDDLIEARARIEDSTKGNIKPNAIIMHPLLYYKLLREAKDSTGRYLADLQGLTANLPDTLLGMKVFLTTVLPTNLTYTDGATTYTDLSMVVMGDFKHALIGQRRGINIAANDGGLYFNEDTIGIKATARVGFTLAYPEAFTVIKNVIAV